MVSIFLLIVISGMSLKDKGKLYLDLKNYKEAILTYNVLIFREPNNEQFRDRLTESVIKFIKERRKTFPEVNLLIERSEKNLHQGNLDSARFYIESALESVPWNEDVLMEYSRVYWLWTKVQKLEREATESEQQKDFNTAYAKWQEIKLVYPAHPEVSRRLRALKPKVAMKVVRKPSPPRRKITRKPPPPKPERKAEEEIQEKVRELYKKGVALYAQGKLKEARDIWREILKLDPKNTKVRRNLAVVEERLRAGGR